MISHWSFSLTVHLGLMESLILGLGGDFNFLSVQESGFGGASFGADPFDYDGVSIDCSIEDYVSFRHHCCCRICRTNHQFWIESVKKSCW